MFWSKTLFQSFLDFAHHWFYFLHFYSLGISEQWLALTEDKPKLTTHCCISIFSSANNDDALKQIGYVDYTHHVNVSLDLWRYIFYVEI